jgi:subfamily B ATP-binding cassette protein MsbA
MGATVLMVLAAAMTGTLAKLMEPIIDDVFTSQNEDMLWPVALAVFGAFAIRGLATYGHSVMLNKVGQRVVADIQRDLFAHIMTLDLGFFQKMKSGQLLSRVISDATVMRSSVAESLMGVGKNSITLLILIGVMFYQDWKLTLIALVVFPLAAIFVMRLGKKLRKVSSHAQHELGDLSTDLTQAFQGVRHVKAYGMIGHENDRINNGVEKIFKLTVKGFRVSALATPLSEILSGLAIVTIIVYGGYQVIAGESTAGQLFSFITAFLLAYEPMKRLAKLNNVLQIGLAAADRIFSILDIQPHVKDEPGAKSLVTDDYTIGFEQVSFSYPDGTEALENVDISVPSGQTIALVGSSGSGKSTIINLIPRFYDVQGGAIKIGGTDIRDVSLQSLRSNMALVSQEVTIFNDTLHDNIAYGTPLATREQVIEAAKSAAAHEFIIKLPEGYDTIVGEQGVKLSGGQRQRVAIARAMLRNAPILLMDEATSALDTESERLVQNALERLREGRTTLVVAHRMSTIKNADYIYVMEDGKVVEEGRHNQLLLKKGIYSKLYGMDFKETA